MLSGTSDFSQRAVAPMPGRATARPSGGWYTREEAIMGTAIKVELWCGDAREAQAAMAAVIDEMHRIDRTMSPHKADSELSRINAEAAERPVPLSEEMLHLLQRAQHFAQLSNGAFDITYAGAGHLYDYRAAVGPSDEALAAARATIGWRQMELDARAGTVRFTRPGVRIDLGGFAKGHAVENAGAILAGRGILHAVVTAGGDSRVLGDRRGRPWMIGVRDPRREGEMVAVLPLEDVAVSTSGDYERFFERDGVRHHHLIDPKTGRSPTHVRGVTVIANDGLTSEALSKCVFVLGVRDGLRLVESLPGADAVVIDAQGQLHYSAGLMSAA